MKQKILLLFFLPTILLAFELLNINMGRSENSYPPRPYDLEKILCLSVGSYNYGPPVLFYGFGQSGQMALQRAQNKCYGFGFYNCPGSMV